MKYSTALGLAVVTLVLLSARQVFCQEPTIKSVVDKNTRVFKLIIQNPLRDPIVITKVGAKVSNIQASRPGCLFAFRLETQDSRPLQIDADYTIPINATQEHEVLQDAEPPLLIGPRGVSRISISVLPDVSYFDTCFNYWKLNLSVFVIYKNVANGRAERLLGPNAISYTASEYDSYDSRSVQLPSKDLARALSHISPTIRAYAIRQLIGSDISRSVAEGILRSKLEGDPSSEVKLAAAYVAAKLGFRNLGDTILQQFKATQDQEAIRIYCWALAELQCLNAVDWLLNTLMNSAATPFGYESYASKYHYTPKEALINMGRPDEVSEKGREALVKYRKWSEPVATDEQRLKYSELFNVLLRYRDIKAVPLIVEIVNSPSFFHRKNPLYEVWTDFIISEINSTKDRLISDEFTLGLRAAFEVTFKFRNPEASATDERSNLALGPLYSRSFAFALLSRMPLNDQDLNSLILLGLADDDLSVRVQAAHTAAVLGRKEFIPQIRSIIDKLDKHDWHTTSICESLNKLGASHNACEDR
jgi:HEAT repeat protein